MRLMNLIRSFGVKDGGTLASLQNFIVATIRDQFSCCFSQTFYVVSSLGFHSIYSETLYLKYWLTNYIITNK